GDGTLDEYEVVFGVDAHHAEVADRNLLSTVTAGHFLALLRAAATAVTGVGTDAAGGTVVLLDAVAGRQARKVVPFHGARGAAALGGAGHVYRGDILEDVCGLEYGAGLMCRCRFEPKLTDVALRLAVGLGWDGDSRIAAGPPSLRLQLRRDVTAFGT